jgi:glycosyltransferase involved in cell wall biosynthesis
MRIGVNSLYLIPGGVGGTESYLRNLLRGLERLAVDDEVVLYTNVENHDSFVFANPRFRKVRCPVRAVSRPRRLLWEQVALPWQARRDRIDVLHSPGYTAPLVDLGCASVVTIHDLNYHFFPEDWSRAGLLAHRLLIPRVARHATRVLTVSRCSADAIRDVLGVPEERLDVVHHGADGNLASPSPAVVARTLQAHGLTEDRFLLSVTATHPHKNLDGLLRAYDLACRDWTSPPPLVVVGIKGRAQADVQRMIRAGGGRGRVVLTGWVEDDELAALYQTAHLFVFASKYEGFGFPVLEAMSVGTPVVSSNAASLPELVGDAGLLVDPTDDRAIADAIRLLWNDESRRRQLVDRGHRQVQRFRWDRAADETLASYRRAVAAR